MNNLKKNTELTFEQIAFQTNWFKKQMKKPYFHSQMYDGLYEEMSQMFSSWEDWSEYIEQYDGKLRQIIDVIENKISNAKRIGFTDINNIDYVEVLEDDIEEQERLIQSGFKKITFNEFLENIQDID